MGMTTTMLRIPESPPNIDESRELIHEFVEWVNESLSELADMAKQIGPDGQLFASEQAMYLFPLALEEARRDGQIARLQESVAKARDTAFIQHGLYGMQLSMKLANIAHWTFQFLQDGTIPLLERLLQSIDTLLDSVLKAFPGGEAIKELKDAALNALSLVPRER